MNWLTRLFKRKPIKDRYEPKVKTLYDFFESYAEAKTEIQGMGAYIRESMECGDYSKTPSKKILRRYNVHHPYHTMFAWYLLEQYFKGNITIKEDVQPKP